MNAESLHVIKIMLKTEIAHSFSEIIFQSKTETTQANTIANKRETYRTET